MGILEKVGFIALDHMSMKQALNLVKTTSGHVVGYKGHMLLEGALAENIILLRTAGAKTIWYDRKALDTVDTVRGIAKAIKNVGVDIMSVHIAGEIDMMMAAKEHGPSKIFGITELTSLDPPMIENLSGKSPLASVLYRARLARLAGIDGIVCSAQEVAYLSSRRVHPKTDSPRELYGLQFVVPGTRNIRREVDDQARSGTGVQALADGADFLVLGREVTEATNPVTALNQIEAMLTA